MEKDTILTEKEKVIKSSYYDNTLIKINLLRFMNKREVTFMSKHFNEYCIRGLHFALKTDNYSHVDITFLDYAFKFYNMAARDYNIYISTAHYRYIPFFDMNLKKRSIYTSKWFDTQAESHIIDYDILFDFDNHNSYKEMVKDVLLVISQLDKYGIEFYLIPSGSNFQIHIKNYNTYDMQQIKAITESMKNKFKLNSLCLNGIGNSFKIMKCPFGLVGSVSCSTLSRDIINNLLTIKYNEFSYANLKKINPYYEIFIHNTNNEIKQKENLLSFVKGYDLL